MEERMNYLMEDQVPAELLEALPESERELENIQSSAAFPIGRTAGSA